jgi:catechol 2,3-dioxygenase-like lactoylglutathione lyase family enzyme
MTRRSVLAGAAALLPRFVRAETAFQAATQNADVTIVTNRMKELVEFYGGACGLHRMDGPGTRFAIGDAALNLVSPARPATQFAEPMNLAIGIRGVALRLSDADSFETRLVAMGRPKPQFLTPAPTAKLLRTTDPDGNWVELVFAGPDLNHVAVILMVADEAKSRDFYGNTLGLKSAKPHGNEKTGLFYAYELGTATILVKGAEKSAPVRTGPVEETCGYRALTFHVADVDAAAASLRGRGVAIAKQPFVKSTGQRALYATDPDGNYLEFLSV